MTCSSDIYVGARVRHHEQQYLDAIQNGTAVVKRIVTIDGHSEILVVHMPNSWLEAGYESWWSEDETIPIRNLNS